jgi:hypothetical protein
MNDRYIVALYASLDRPTLIASSDDPEVAADLARHLLRKESRPASAAVDALEAGRREALKKVAGRAGRPQLLVVNP